MFTIIPARRCHLPAILAIYNDAIVNSTAVWLNETVDLANREQWLAARHQDNYPVLVAVEQSAEQPAKQASVQPHDHPPHHLLGYASYGAFRAFAGYRHSAELSIYIAGDARGKGVGDALMQALIDHARANHIHVLLGAIEAQNTASLRLHHKHGFSQTGYLPQVGRKFERWLDLVLMQKIL